jgi:prepilin-type N-terminal cleavage/methylation domain-containing protein
MVLKATKVLRLRTTGLSGRRGRAFSLIELLVVIAIIGLLAAIGLPALKGFGRGNAMNAAVRQVLDDLALARLTALNSRTRVSVVFFPPMMDPAILNSYRSYSNAYQTLRNNFDGQMASYAIVTERTVGDQPGRNNPRYVQGWRRLPAGVIFAPWSFVPRPASGGNVDERLHPFLYRNDIPFPTSDGPRGPGAPAVPCLVFSPMGQLETDPVQEAWRTSPDRILTLVPGSVLVARDAEGLPISADLPPLTRREDRVYEETRVRITGLTGRAAVEPTVFGP